jgi:hypothetical protein
MLNVRAPLKRVHWNRCIAFVRFSRKRKVAGYGQRPCFIPSKINWTLFKYSFLLFTEYCTANGTLLHCNENSIYVFLFWELRGLRPNFHIHLSVWAIYNIPRIGPHIFLQQKRQIDYGNIEIADRHINLEIGIWDYGCAIPFWGIFVSNFRYWFFAVWQCWLGLFLCLCGRCTFVVC